MGMRHTVDDHPRLPRQLRAAVKFGAITRTLGAASVKLGPAPLAHWLGMLDGSPTAAGQFGAGAAVPMHVSWPTPLGRPVLTDGAASRAGSMRFRNWPTPPWKAPAGRPPGPGML